MNEKIPFNPFFAIPKGTVEALRSTGVSPAGVMLFMALYERRNYHKEDVIETFPVNLKEVAKSIGYRTRAFTDARFELEKRGFISNERQINGKNGKTIEYVFELHPAICLSYIKCTQKDKDRVGNAAVNNSAVDIPTADVGKVTADVGKPTSKTGDQPVTTDDSAVSLEHVVEPCIDNMLHVTCNTQHSKYTNTGNMSHITDIRYMLTIATNEPEKLKLSDDDKKSIAKRTKDTVNSGNEGAGALWMTLCKLLDINWQQAKGKVADG